MSQFASMPYEACVSLWKVRPRERMACSTAERLKPSTAGNSSSSGTTFRLTATAFFSTATSRAHCSESATYLTPRPVTGDAEGSSEPSMACTARCIML